MKCRKKRAICICCWNNHGNESGNNDNDVEKCDNEAENKKDKSYVVYNKAENIIISFCIWSI